METSSPNSYPLSDKAEESFVRAEEYKPKCYWRIESKLKIVSDRQYDKEQPVDDMDKAIARRGNADKSAKTLEKQLAKRNENTPIDMGTDEKLMRIAKGMGRKLFENPVQLAASLQGFEAWCLEKNVVPSFVGMAMYLNTSKSDLLSYMHSEQSFAVTTLTDAETGEYIFSSIDQDKVDRFAESHYVVQEDSLDSFVSEEKLGSSNLTRNEEKANVDENGNERSKRKGSNKVVSIKDCIENGSVRLTRSVLTYQDVFAPMMNLLEQSTISKGYTMRNPALPIFLMKNRMGATMHYTDRQEIAVESSQTQIGMSDDEILKAADIRPKE